MEALLPILLTMLRSPELAQLLPMLLKVGSNAFPSIPTAQAPAAAATMFDTNGTKWTQTALRILGEVVEVDGVYGEGTKKAVTSFQVKEGLVADGWAGENTVNALRKKLLKSV